MDKGNINISITSGTVAKSVLIVLMFALLYYLRDLVIIVTTSIVIASAIEPMILWFRKFKVARTLAVIIIYLFISVLFAGFFYTFLPSVLSDLTSVLSILPKYLDSLSVWNPAKTSFVSSAVPVAQTFGIAESFSLRELISNFNNAVAGTTGGAVGVLSKIFGGVLSFVLIVVLSFYFAVQEEGVTKFLRIVLPIKYEDYVIGLWQRSRDKIGKWLQGQLLLAILIGILVYLGLMIIGVPNALLLALFAAVFEIIPLFGPILAAIPAFLIAVSQGGWTLGLIVVGYYTIIHQFENHLFYPMVVKKIVGIPPILVILALVVGFEVAGVLGVILSVPIAAVLVEVLDDYQKDKLTKMKK